MKKPFFSIITCTHNSEKYLKECLDSVLNQKFEDYEHLIIDGFSTDKTLEIVKTYQKINSKVKLFQNKPEGIAEAMNQGISQAKGEYLYFLHSDDSLSTHNLLGNINRDIKKLNFPDWIYGQIQVVDGEGQMLGVFPRQSIFHYPSRFILKYFNYIPHQAVFVRHIIFEKFGTFDQSLKTVMDYDFWLRLANYTRWFYVPTCVANYRIHSNAQSSSRSNLKKNLSELILMRRRYLNRFEMLMAVGFDFILSKVNKTLQ